MLIFAATLSGEHQFVCVINLLSHFPLSEPTVKAMLGSEIPFMVNSEPVQAMILIKVQNLTKRKPEAL